MQGGKLGNCPPMKQWIVEKQGYQFFLKKMALLCWVTALVRGNNPLGQCHFIGEMTLQGVPFPSQITLIIKSKGSPCY